MFPFFSTSIHLLCSPPSGHNLWATVSLWEHFSRTKIENQVKNPYYSFSPAFCVKVPKNFIEHKIRLMISKSMAPLLGFLFLPVKLTFHMTLVKDTEKITRLPRTETEPQLLCPACPWYTSQGRCSAHWPPPWTRGSLRSWSVYLAPLSQRATWSLCSIKVCWWSEWVCSWRGDRTWVC